jgi:multimeric flavodoxin WrbA
MGDPKHLLVIYHSGSGTTEAMARAVVEGAEAAGGEAVEVRARRAPEADADDVRWCQAAILGTPEKFGYMSGALKDFFDRVYYALLEETQGLPWALFVKAGNDGSGAVASVRRIVTGLRWREVQPPLVVTGDLGAADLERCRELGAAVAAGLEIGIFG